MKVFVEALLVLLVAGVSCGGEPALYDGHFTVGFEKSEFVPCGSVERWWVDGAAALPLANSVSGGQGAKFFVKWRGEKSKKGRFGHLGEYDRVFKATALVESRAPNAQDCK